MVCLARRIGLDPELSVRLDFYIVNANSGHIVSRHLVALLRERIASGLLPPGARLPGAAEISREYGLAPNTVQRALDALRDEGLVVVRDGDGMFVRETQRPDLVTLAPGDTVSARMPTLRECTALGISRHVPVLVVVRAGGASECYPGGATRLAAGG